LVSALDTAALQSSTIGRSSLGAALNVEICHECEMATHPGALFCGECGTAMPHSNPALREQLLECFIDLCDSEELSEWLQQIQCDPRGRIDDKRERIRQHTQYLTMPARDFPKQTIAYLNVHKTYEAAARACEALGLSADGPRATLVRRVLRHVHQAEHWLPSLESPSSRAVRAVVKRYLITVRGNEKEYCDEFEEEAEDIWPRSVHPQYPIAHGTTLRIDFHIGSAGAPGVGVEFKLPRSNADIQRAKGQLEQYLTAYSEERLILVVLDDQKSLKLAQLDLFEQDARALGIEVVRRRV
jgi:hypothetical protein